ncbi:MAG TPA: glycoside hydrolase family 97 protein [Pyrinomonadaceae bacterium]|nr:glycoside hydrolase family 97 protein [Pyrinomonadaceae bacterium]
MKKILFLILLVQTFAFAVSAQEYLISSPNKRAEVRLRIADKVYYSLLFDNKTIVSESPISISVKEISPNFKVKSKNEKSVNQTVTAVVPQKRRKIKDNFNELTLSFENGLGLIWRIYDNGAAYRWTSDLAGQITVNNEQAEINLDPNDVLFYPQEDEGFYSHNERLYIKYKSSELAEKLASTPTLAATKSGVKLFISEADLYDYAGMWLRGNSGKGLKAVFPNYPNKEVVVKDRDVKVAERADFIAQTSGKRNFPWRVFGIAERDADLLDNQLVYLLSEDTKEDFSWVRGGKVPWDWWNANNIYGVDFKSGVNTETYKYYIDFAAKYGLEYLILDEGWSKTDDLLTLNPEVNLPELLDYAKKKNVGVILWVLWTSLDKQFIPALDQFEKWGVKGIKVDFMQRDDQKMVNFYERTAKEAAKRKMLVDFHGAYKPTGMSRKYPNVISYEGVKGLENSKWSKDITPEHDVTLPFIRMVAGAMDFTPGAMINALPKDFQINFNRPMSQGTRCHQLAMYVVYESPLQMLADNPSNYLRESEAMEFLSKVPSVWNETVPLDGKIGEYVAIARQTEKGEWFVGAMNNSTEREITLDFSFLDGGNYEATVWQDGINSNRFASDFKKYSQTVKKGDKLNVKLGIGGGWVARLVKK